MYIYSAEFCTGWLATAEAIVMWYMLRYLGIPVKGTTDICGEKLGIIISSTNPDPELKNKHVVV